MNDHRFGIYVQTYPGDVHLSSVLVRSIQHVSPEIPIMIIPGDVYRNDFGMGDGLICLSLCLVYLDEQDQLAIGALLEEGVVSVKFQPSCQDFRPNLTELR